MNLRHRRVLMAFGFAWSAHTLAAMAQCPDSFTQKLIASDPASGDLFGTVAASADVLFAGAPNDDDLGSSSGSVYAFRRTPTDWVEQQKLLTMDSVGGDAFGTAVATNADWLVAGSPGDDDAGFEAGSAYFFAWDGSTWVERRKLLANDASLGAQFGRRMAMHEDVVVIAAPSDDVNLPNGGAVYVYRFDGLDWQFEAKLTSNDLQLADEFGTSVAVHEDVIVVGVPRKNAAGARSGVAYVFRFDGLVWNQEVRLEALSPAAGDQFGTAVAVGRDVAVVGAPLRDTVGADSGAAFVFTFDGTQWSQQTTLTAPDAQPDDVFGSQVAMHADTLVIAAPNHDVGATDVGAAYLYRNVDGTWNRDEKLLAFDAADNDTLGRWMALTKNEVIVGAPFDNHNGTDAGSAYVFTFGRREQSKLIASDTIPGQAFGRAVAVDTDVALVGAPRFEPGNPTPGSAYLYRFDGTDWSEEQIVPAPGSARFFGSAVDVHGDVALIAGRETAFVYRDTGTAWAQEQELVPSQPGGQDFGAAVSVFADTALVGASSFQGGRGRVYVFRFDGTRWNEEQTLSAPSDDGAFGFSLDHDASHVIVGAPFAGTTGAATVFAWQGSQWQQVQILTAADAAPNFFGTSVGVHGNAMVIGAPGDGDAGFLAGAAYVFESNGTQWQEIEKLSVTGAGPHDQAGLSVAVSNDEILVGRPRSPGETLPGSAHLFRPDGAGWTEVRAFAAAEDESGNQFGAAVSLTDGQALVGAPLQDHSGKPEAGAAYLLAVEPLALDIDPTALQVGDWVTIITCGGLPGTPAVLFVVSIGGVPVQPRLAAAGTFDPRGRWVVSGPVLRSLNNTTVTFRVWTLEPRGGLLSSNDVTVQMN